MRSFNRILFYFFICLRCVCESLGGTPSGNIRATRCSFADVSAAIAAANSGDTVMVLAGRATWDSNLIITKGIRLIGAGATETVIIKGANVGLNTCLIRYCPSNPAANESFRFSGFTLDDAAGGELFNIYNMSATTAISNIRVDHNRFLSMATGANFASVYFRGQVYGCIDNNYFSGDGHFDFEGFQENSWNNFIFDYGSANNLYFEDNEIHHTWSSITSESGSRWVVRYNKFVYEGTTTLSPWMDAHGNQPNGPYALMGCEAYGNLLTDAGGHDVKVFHHRGGKALFFFNKAQDASYAVILAQEEFSDSISPTTNPQPQHVSDSYYWNNRRSNNILVTSEVLNNPGVEYSIAENVDFHNYTPTFNGTSGMGCGPLASRPSTCTVGVAYWATDQDCSLISSNSVGPNPSVPISGTLYKATSTNVWTPYYTPYIYPHPLRASR